MTTLLLLLTIAAALGSGLVAGIFFAFSTFVMKALGRLPGAQGIAAMQSINIVVLNPMFFLAFFGTGLVCACVGAAALAGAAGARWPLLVTGSALYLVGTILVTIVCNVPLNDGLARATPDTAEGAAVWRRYRAVWTAWNHVRTVAALAAAVCFTVALF